MVLPEPATPQRMTIVEEWRMIPVLETCKILSSKPLNAAEANG